MNGQNNKTLQTKKRKATHHRGSKSDLTTQHKLFICERLAKFAGWDEIAHQFLAAFGHEVAMLGQTDDPVRWIKGRINYYCNHPAAKKWQKLIEKLRASWLERIKEEALANKRVRIRELSKDYHLLDPGGAPPEDADIEAKIEWWASVLGRVDRRMKILDQVASECGDKVDRKKVEKDINIKADADWVDRLAASFAKENHND